MPYRVRTQVHGYPGRSPDGITVREEEIPKMEKSSKTLVRFRGDLVASTGELGIFELEAKALLT
jgi:hypothetical protein